MTTAVRLTSNAFKSLPNLQSTYRFNVTMTCGGCSGAVNRALSRTAGVEKVDIDMEKQLVEVTATIPKDDVFNVIKKTGKAVTPLPDTA